MSRIVFVKFAGDGRIVASSLRNYLAIVEERDSILPLVHFPTSAGSMSLINECTLYPSVVTKF